MRSDILGDSSGQQGYVSALWSEVISAKLEHPQIAARLLERQTAVSSQHPVQWLPSDVTRWLEAEELSDFIPVFSEYNGLSLLTLSSAKLMTYATSPHSPLTTQCSAGAFSLTDWTWWWQRLCVASASWEPSTNRFCKRSTS